MQDTVLVRFGGMGFGENNVEKLVHVASPVAAHLFHHALRRGERGWVVQPPGCIAAGDDQMRHPLGLFGGQPQGDHGRRRDRHDRGAVDLEPVQHGHEVGVVVVERISLGRAGPVRPAVAAQVHHDHPEVLRKVRHDALEQVRVGDLEHRREGEPGAAVAVLPVPGAHALPFDKAFVQRCDRLERIELGQGARCRQRAGSAQDAFRRRPGIVAHGFLRRTGAALGRVLDSTARSRIATASSASR